MNPEPQEEGQLPRKRVKELFTRLEALEEESLTRAAAGEFEAQARKELSARRSESAELRVELLKAVARITALESSVRHLKAPPAV